MTKLYLDYETYARINIKVTGAYRYIEDPDFLPLMAAWAVDDGPVQVAVGPTNIRAIPGLFDEDVTVVAHNAAFERLVTGWLAGLPQGQYLDPRRWHDTMAVAAERGLPQGLDQLAAAVTGERKDSAGTRLINWFCRPDPRTGKRRRPADHPEKWAEFVEYCRQDVVALRAVHKAMGGHVTRTELAVYLADQAINDRGALLDRELAEAAVAAAEENQTEQLAELARLVKVDNPNSVQQLAEGLEEELKLPVPDLKAATVTEQLARTDLTDKQRRALELRQELALSASKKYQAALDTMCADNRMRGGFRFFGAHTGRWAGRGLQPHNLPREQLKDDVDGLTGEEKTELVIDNLKMGGGASAYQLKALVRALFLGPLTVVDYAAIEARVIAWLAGEEWALQAFRDGRDIYVETAERMSSPTKTFERRDGKIAVLALGYSGGTGSMKAMGAQGSETELERIVRTWRDANPNICHLWGAIESALRFSPEDGEKHPIEPTELLQVSRHRKHYGEDVKLWLPSGRAITYRNLKWAKRDVDINGNRFAATSPASRWSSPTFIDPRKGLRVRTYGGRLAENVTQAVARDVLAEALVRLEEHGYRTVGHVHDEVLVEGEHTVEDVAELISTPPEWAEGLPIDAEGFTAQRYRKG